MDGWHHRWTAYELEQTSGDGEGQRGLVCCSPWGLTESDMTERLNKYLRTEWDAVRGLVHISTPSGGRVKNSLPGFDKNRRVPPSPQPLTPHPHWGPKYEP